MNKIHEKAKIYMQRVALDLPGLGPDEAVSMLLYRLELSENLKWLLADEMERIQNELAAERELADQLADALTESDEMLEYDKNSVRLRNSGQQTMYALSAHAARRSK